MKKEIKEEPDVEEFIKEETPPEEHVESFCPEWNKIRVAALSHSSADYSNVTIQSTDGLSYLLNPLIEADAVYHGEGDSLFLDILWHGINIGN
jgi:hypothetical protein